ncbi:MAG: VWA domain-containing protein [Alphaproteobacteria bacterium]|nr:VWA domain-containing protein [Alphaproteobacteria bacterium]
MKAFIHTLVVLACAGLLTPGLAFGQTDEERRYAEQVREARTEASAAQAELDAALAQGRPVMERYEALAARLDELSAELAAAQTRVQRADRAVSSVPVTLTARRDALSDRLVRLYETGADPDAIAEMEAALEDVRRQIARAESDGAPARLRRLQADMAADRLYEQVQVLRGQVRDLERGYDAARIRIESARRRLDDARNAMNLAQDNARIFLADTAPPFLRQVVVGAGGATVYEAEWTEPAVDLEGQLRLARYLLEDLTRSTERRGEIIEEWITILQADQAEADRRLAAYVDMIGGSHDGVLGYVERGLDAVSGGTLGALITGGSHTWTKIGVEFADAMVSAGMNMQGGMLPHHALAVEAIFQLTDVAARAIKGEPKNETWSVEALPMANDAIRSARSGAAPGAEQAFIQRVDSAQVRTTLEALYARVSVDPDAEDFRDQLVAEHGVRTLAAVFGRSTAYSVPPDPDMFEPDTSVGAGLGWLQGQFESPTGVGKSVLIELVFGEDPNVGRAAFLGLVQSAIRDGILTGLEAQRLEVWEAYINADIQARLSAAFLQHEGRARLVERHIQTILADEVIPALEDELDRVAGQRTLEVRRDAQVRGRRADMTLTFSAPVTITSLTLGGEALTPSGSGAEWTVRFDPRDLTGGDAGLAVEAEHAAVAGRLLDDPRTITVWDPIASRMERYEQGPDTHHGLTLDPPAGAAFALVLDTSGSMAPDESPDPNASRFSQAQAALTGLLSSGQLRAGDEAALYTFDGACGARVAAPFTSDLDAVQAAVTGAVANGNTPLAATIIAAADGLSERNAARGVIIVVTDGQEACNQSVPDAVAYAEERADRLVQLRRP